MIWYSVFLSSISFSVFVGRYITGTRIVSLSCNMLCHPILFFSGRYGPPNEALLLYFIIQNSQLFEHDYNGAQRK